MSFFHATYALIPILLYVILKVMQTHFYLIFYLIRNKKSKNVTLDVFKEYRTTPGRMNLALVIISLKHFFQPTSPLNGNTGYM